MTYAEVNSAALAAEAAEGQHGRRVVAVFSDDPGAPALWYGVFGNAPVSTGAAGYRLSDGEVVTI